MKRHNANSHNAKRHNPNTINLVCYQLNSMMSRTGCQAAKNNPRWQPACVYSKQGFHKLRKLFQGEILVKSCSSSHELSIKIDEKKYIVILE